MLLSVDSCTDVKLHGEIRIKTLEEIKQEKASRSQEPARTGSICTAAKPPGPLKRPGKVLASPDIRKYSEVFHAKKKLEAKKRGGDSEASLSEKKDILMDMGPQGEASAKMEEVRVKTLDEIRREKAARMQAKVEDAQTEKQPSIDKGIPKRRILRINKSMATGIHCIVDTIHIRMYSNHHSTSISAFMYYLNMILASLVFILPTAYPGQGCVGMEPIPGNKGHKTGVQHEWDASSLQGTCVCTVMYYWQLGMGDLSA